MKEQTMVIQVNEDIADGEKELEGMAHMICNVMCSCAENMPAEDGYTMTFGAYELFHSLMVAHYACRIFKSAQTRNKIMGGTQIINVKSDIPPESYARASVVLNDIIKSDDGIEQFSRMFADKSKSKVKRLFVTARNACLGLTGLMEVKHEQ